jgi:hypothetical protein
MTSLKNFYPLTRRTMLGVMGGAMVLAAWPFALHARPPKRVLKCRARRALEQPAVVADPAAQTDTGLTPEQAETVRRLVEVMIPSDTTPGAADTGSADFVLASLAGQDEETREAIAQAISAVDALALQAYGQPFRLLPPDSAQQVASIVSSHPQLAVFWHQVRSLAVLHFYAQPEGYEPLGLPGPSIDRGGYPGGVADDGSVFCPVA